MNRLAAMLERDRRTVVGEAAARLQLNPVMVEKDFWVCWMLGLLFGNKDWNAALVFKGGTALSKVFAVIRRFSEDIDLSVSPGAVGISETAVEQAASRRQRDEWMARLETACGEWVREQLQPGLEEAICGVLGRRPLGKTWLEFENDVASHSPVLLFHYPSTLETGSPYVRPSVKLEFGSLTDQRPVGNHAIRPWLAQVLPEPLATMGCEVVAMEVERAFWEKATILHAEFHRDPRTAMQTHYSRHYSDLAAMAERPEAERALADDRLRERVAAWKSQFFARAWARYELARPGTFRLVPPPERVQELERDYQEMREMFLDLPPPFATILETLGRLESRINRIP